jgi:small subunit ribosomal protein S1
MDSDRRQVDEYHATQGTLDQSLGRAAKQNRKRSQADDDK